MVLNDLFSSVHSFVVISTGQVIKQVRQCFITFPKSCNFIKTFPPRVVFPTLFLDSGIVTEQSLSLWVQFLKRLSRLETVSVIQQTLQAILINVMRKTTKFHNKKKSCINVLTICSLHELHHCGPLLAFTPAVRGVCIFIFNCRTQVS